jgi:D-alanine transaminase
MARIAWLDGAYVPLAEARISPLDRGFTFGDGVYEVTAVLDGRLVESASHLARLERSAVALDIPLPLPVSEIEAIERELIARNGIAEGGIYLQLTRGVAERDFLARPDRPTLFLFAQSRPILTSPLAERGAVVISLPDLRWARRDIKSVNLLAQVLAKQAAQAAGADEAWMIEDGFVTEGASATAMIVTRDGTLVVRPNSQAILPGCTRIGALEVAAQAGLPIEERSFTLEEALAAREAMLTSASMFVMPVVRIDGQPIGNGAPGPIARDLRARYIALARSRA